MSVLVCFEPLLGLEIHDDIVREREFLCFHTSSIATCFNTLPLVLLQDPESTNSAGLD